jgi:hypothetical protein
MQWVPGSDFRKKIAIRNAARSNAAYSNVAGR